MEMQISRLNTRNLFKIIFSLYILVGMHINMGHMGGYGLYLPFNAIGWMFISLMIGIGLWHMASKRIVEYSQFMLYCLVGLVMLLLPLIYPNNEHSHLAIQRILGLCAGVLLFFCLQQFHFNRADRIQLLYIILMGILVQACYGLSQKFLPLEDWFGRPLAILMQKNNMATFLVTGAAISLYLFIKDDEIRNSWIKAVLVLGTPFLTSILYIPLQSRTGYITFFISVLIISIGNMDQQKKLGTWLAVAILGFIIGANSSYNSRSDENMNRSVNTRMVLYELSYYMWKKQPFMGVGYGNYFSHLRHNYAEISSADSTILVGSGNMDHPHNETLLWMTEGGILPLFGLLIIAGGFLAILWLAKDRRQSFGIAGLILPILIHTQLELPFYLSLVHWFLFIFLLSFIDEEIGEWKTKRLNLNFAPRIIAVLIPAIVIPLMVTALQTGRVITKYERTGYKNTQLLFSAWNPKNLNKKYDVLAMSLHLSLAKKTGDKDKFQDYIEWAEDYIQHSPFSFIYYDLAKAYEAVGLREKGWAVYNKARYLFPDLNWQDATENSSSSHSLLKD